MPYRTVYDVAAAGHLDPALLLGLIPLGLGLGWLAQRRRFPGWGRRHPVAGIVASAALCAMALLSLYLCVCMHRGKSALLQARSTGNFQVEEGVVTDFDPMPAAGHAEERFCVSGTCFAYSDYVLTGGFNNAASHGGPIREGLRVRVSHVGGTIVKLEVEP